MALWKISTIDKPLASVTEMKREDANYQYQAWNGKYHQRSDSLGKDNKEMEWTHFYL